MKDLIAKLQADANVAMGSIWLHIEAREKRIAELEAERDDADRRAGAAERSLAYERDGARARNDWLRDAKKAWGVTDAVSFDVIWDEALALKNAASTALQAPVREVPGYKLVPVAITEAMHVAAVKAIIRSTGNDDCPPNVWRAMLAAAPLPAVPVQEPKP